MLLHLSIPAGRKCRNNNQINTFKHKLQYKLFLLAQIVLYGLKLYRTSLKLHVILYKSYTLLYTNSTKQLSYSKEARTENHCLLLCLYCSEAAGSPEVAVIYLSNPFFQHVFLSSLLLSGVCQRDRTDT